MFVSNFKRGQHIEVYMNLAQVKKFVYKDRRGQNLWQNIRKSTKSWQSDKIFDICLCVYCDCLMTTFYIFDFFFFFFFSRCIFDNDLSFYKIHETVSRNQIKFDRTLIFVFAYFLLAVVKVLVLEERLGTRLCLYPNLRFF